MVVDQEEIHRLSLSEDKKDREKASEALAHEFRSLPDKSAAWGDLHRLTRDEDSDVRRWAAYALGSVFSYVPDKYAAWDDLIRLTSCDYTDFRWNAAYALGSAFSYVPDKSAAWDDLHRLTRDEDSWVRKEAADAIGSAFSYVPDKSAAWNDLHWLTSDGDSGVRRKAAAALGYAFSYVPDKSAAWDDLHRLTSDEDSWVRMGAAGALGSAFSSVPDKSAAWDDLHRLTSDEKDSNVRMYANHSLGKICIYIASKSESEDDSKALLEEAINYFEKATKEIALFNPATFCLLFYRSFDAVIFKKVYSKKEIEDYITAAKREIWGSKSKQKLIEAIEQLAKALEIAHGAHESGGDWQETLKRCSDICNRVDELMLENKDNTPAIFDFYEKNKPSFDKNIKELIDEIKEKAKITCKETQGTPAEGVACSINKEIQKWKIESQEDMEKNFHNLIDMMRIMVPDIPANHLLISKINSIENYTKPEDVCGALCMIFPLIENMSLAEDIKHIKSTVDEIKVDVKQVDKKIYNLSINVEQVMKQIMEQPNPQEYLDLIQQILENIQDEIPEMKDDIKKVLDDLYSPLRIERKLKISIPLIPLFMSYEAQVTPSKFVGDRIFEFKRLYSKLKI